MSERAPFRFIRRWRDSDGRLNCEYEGSFWNGEAQRYDRVRCLDKVFVNPRTKSSHFLNTAPNVSYYDALKKACGL